jgi:hypothetical protein
MLFTYWKFQRQLNAEHQQETVSRQNRDSQNRDNVGTGNAFKLPLGRQSYFICFSLKLVICLTKCRRTHLFPNKQVKFFSG